MASNSVLMCSINGVNFGPSGNRALKQLHLMPKGESGIGTATLTLMAPDYGIGYEIRNRMEVKIYLADRLSGWITRRLFGGFVALPSTSLELGTDQKTIEVECQDYNILLDYLVGDLTNNFFYGSVKFKTKIQNLITGLTSGATASIDTTSAVSDLQPASALPGSYTNGRRLRAMLDEIMDQVQYYNTALKPVYMMGLLKTTGTTVFGGPVLYAFDKAASSPTISAAFNNSPGAGQQKIYPALSRELDGEKLVNRRQLEWGSTGAFIATGVDSTSQGLYPNPYSASNSWMDVPIIDHTNTGTPDPQLVINQDVADTAYPLESLEHDSDQFIAPGEFVTETLTHEGLTDQTYQVADAEIYVVGADNWRTSLTMGLPVLELFETKAGTPVRPVEQWSPLDLGTQVKLWLRSDAALLSEDRAVATWPDRSQYGNNATQSTGANRPTYKEKIFGNLPAVYFDGVNDYLDLPNFLTSFTEGEIFLVGKIAADPPTVETKTGLWRFGSDAFVSNLPWVDGIIYDQFGTNVRKSTINPSISMASPFIYNVVSKAGEWTSRLNGYQQFTTAPNTVGWATNPKLGKDTYAGVDYLLNGWVGAVILCSGVLTAANRLKMLTYLSNLYGVTANLSE